jgi:hypothetical protein
VYGLVDRARAPESPASQSVLAQRIWRREIMNIPYLTIDFANPIELMNKKMVTLS